MSFYFFADTNYCFCVIYSRFTSFGGCVLT